MRTGSLGSMTIISPVSGSCSIIASLPMREGLTLKLRVGVGGLIAKVAVFVMLPPGPEQVIL